LISFY